MTDTEAIPTYIHTFPLIYGLIENDLIFSSSLADALMLREDTESVYKFSCGEEALSSSKLSEINFLLVDYRLDGMDGISFLAQKEIIEKRIPKLILTGFNAEEKVFEALKYGATGYMFKEEMESLNSVLEILLKGGAFISPSIASRVISFFQEKVLEIESEILTDREIQILEELCNGYSPKEIADIFQISVSTVRIHIKNIYVKMEVNNQRQLISKLLAK